MPVTPAASSGSRGCSRRRFTGSLGSGSNQRRVDPRAPARDERLGGPDLHRHLLQPVGKRVRVGMVAVAAAQRGSRARPAAHRPSSPSCRRDSVSLAALAGGHAERVVVDARAEDREHRRPIDSPTRGVHIHHVDLVDSEVPALQRVPGAELLRVSLFEASAYLRHNGVVKYGRLRHRDARRCMAPLPRRWRSDDAPTRERVAASILENGPSTAAALAERLDLTPAAVRRHLDHLVAEGAVEAREPRIYGTRGRGRPAKVFVLTDSGRDTFNQAYDDLAVSALRFLREAGGPEAVAEFARRRTAELEERYRAAVQAATAAERAEALAEALTGDGYAASVRSGARRRPAVPAPLPGRPRRRRVPAAVRGRDRSLRPPARPSRPAPGDHRPRRRRLHHQRPCRAAEHCDASARHRKQSAHPPRPGGPLHDIDRAAQPRARGPRPLRVRLGRLRPRRRHRAARSQRVRRTRHLRRCKSEPQWMLDLRLKGLKLFDRKPMPTWGSDLSAIDFDNIKYFVRSTEKQATSWEELPEDIKNTYDRLGIPEAEKQRLVAGVAAQYESEVVYHKIREDLEEQGVLFLDTDTGAARARGHLQGVLRLGHPGRRQQVRRAQHLGVVRRLVHLRAEGCPRRHPAAGLLPDQHREHGPVRAHADHRRRRRLRALRRGLHRADLHAPTRCTRPSSRSSSRRAPAAATRRSRTGPTTSTTW